MSSGGGSSASANLYAHRRTSCLCRGCPGLDAEGSARPHTPGSRGQTGTTHRIWIAFLRLENEEYDGEASMRDYCCLPMNKLTVWLTQRPWIHCQLVFWDEENRCYYTFSVDSMRAVHVYDRKEFARGWDFIDLQVSEQSELAIHNFLVGQLGRSMNTSGQLMALFFPLDSGGRRWFCSELVAAALECGGVIDFDTWDGVDAPCAVVMHMLYDYLLRDGAHVRARLLSINPVVKTTIMQTFENPKARIELRAGDGLPQSVAAAALMYRESIRKANV